MALSSLKTIWKLTFMYIKAGGVCTFEVSNKSEMLGKMFHIIFLQLVLRCLCEGT